jgi:NTP pyrophosphatase (non-canonical NTP hydrolase)
VCNSVLLTLAFYKDLMNKQEYLFNLVGEECGEVAQAANKCVRFTPHHAYYEHSNLKRMQIEITDLMTVLSMLQEHLNIEFDFKPCEEKKARIEKYMQISRDMGVLDA